MVYSCNQRKLCLRKWPVNDFRKRTSFFEEKIDVHKIEKYLYLILSSYNVKTTLTIDEIIDLIKSKSKEEDLKEKLV